MYEIELRYVNADPDGKGTTTLWFYIARKNALESRRACADKNQPGLSSVVKQLIREVRSLADDPTEPYFESPWFTGVVKVTSADPSLIALANLQFVKPKLYKAAKDNCATADNQ